MKSTVVVTGASRGIGRACVSHLLELGFDVLAAVRTEDQVRALPEGAQPVFLDLSQPDRVEEAVGGILDRAPSLAGLVNNAGISRAGALEDLPSQAIREVLEIDLLGPLELTRRLLPSLRRGQGRIVNVGSGEGFLATPLNAPYCMAKHALEALSDSLRLELAPAGVPLSVVSPGQTETRILETARAELRDVGQRASAPYRSLTEPRLRMATRRGMPPARVAEAVGRALTARRPRPRYFVGLDARGAYLLGRVVPAAARRLFMRQVLGFR